MSEMGEISDYIYGAMMAIVSIVFGTSYPLILQAIQRITDVYNDDKMVKRFLGEPIYRCFKWCLIIAIFINVLMPVYIYLRHEKYPSCLTYKFVIIQIIVTIVLIISSFLLYDLITKYFNHSDLLKHYKRKKKQVDFMPLYCSIMFQCDASGNRDTYFSALECIGNIIYNYQRVFYEKDENKHRTIDYPDYVYKTLNDIVNVTVKEETRNFLPNESSLINLMYNSTDNVLVSNKTLNCMWMHVNKMVDANHFSWFKSYWEFADQYYRSTINVSPDTDKVSDTLDEIKERFLLMHFMMGGLMLYEEKYEWLYFMLTFSNVLPYEYALVPSSFQEIWRMLGEVGKKKEWPMTLTSHFPFIRMTNDVNADSIIYKFAEQYSALLLMRLNSVPPYNASICGLPDVCDGILANERLIELCDNLKNDIEELYNKDEQKNCLNYSKDNAIQLVEELKEKAERRNEKFKHENSIDEQKIEKIQDEIKNTCNEINPLYLPPPDTDDECKLTLYSMRMKLRKEQICKGYDTSYCGFVEGILNRINSDVRYWFECQFMLTREEKHYQIHYKEIFKAIDALKVDNSYAIVLMNVYLGNFTAIYGDVPYFVEMDDGAKTYKGIPIYSINTRNLKNWIAVIKTHDMPKVDYTDAEVDEEYKPNLTRLEGTIGVYANIDELKDAGNFTGAEELIIGRALKHSTPKQLKYIKLSITHDPTIGGSDLDKIMPIIREAEICNTKNKLINLKLLKFLHCKR